MNQIVAQKEKVKDMRAIFDHPKVKSGLGAIIPKFMTLERMLRICANAIEKTPLLAECSQSTVLGSVMTSAALGLEPNTIAGHAYLIPYKARKNINDKWVDVYECQFQMGYKGYIELAYRNENCVNFNGLSVYENDVFRHYIGSDLGELSIEYEASRKERGALEGAFSIAVFDRGNGARGRASLWMPEEDILKIREKSQTFTSLRNYVANARSEKERERAQKKLDETPWNMWAPDMYAKTAIRKLAKQLPIFGNVLAAAQVEDGSDMGTIDMQAMSDPATARAVISGEEDYPVIADGRHDPETGEVIDNDAKTDKKSAKSTKATKATKQAEETADNSDEQPAQTSADDAFGDMDD